MGTHTRTGPCMGTQFPSPPHCGLLPQSPCRRPTRPSARSPSMPMFGRRHRRRRRAARRSGWRVLCRTPPSTRGCKARALYGWRAARGLDDEHALYLPIVRRRKQHKHYHLSRHGSHSLHTALLACSYLPRLCAQCVSLSLTLSFSTSAALRLRNTRPPPSASRAISTTICLSDAP